MHLRFSPVFSKRETYELRLGGSDGRIDGGLNAEDLPHTLDPSQSPDCCNVWFYEGTITKRWGQRVVGALNLNKGITAAITDGKGNAVLQCGANLYRMRLETGIFEEVGTLQGTDPVPAGTFFRYGDSVYFLNGTDFLVSDGGMFQAVTPYIPIVLAGRSPSGSSEGTVRGRNNVLTNRYRISFSGDGSSTVYTFPAGYEISSEVITAVVDGVELVENSGFSVNRTNRTATFSAAPAAGVDNVVFTLTGTSPVSGSELLSCRHAIVYAGDSRVILGGNGTNVLYYSEPYLPTYFPAENRLPIGNEENITGFGRQYDLLAVFKEHEIATVSYSYVSGSTQLRASILSPVVGCDMPGSICNMDNRIVFANTEQGICLITSTSLENERNVLAVSRNINPMLLAESREAMTEASACCFEGRYWLSVGNHVYLWDNVARPVQNSTSEDALRRLAWYYFENISAAAWLPYQNTLYYARREPAGEETDAIIQFGRQFQDFGEAIPARWRSAALDFGRPNWYKTLERIWFVCRGAVPVDMAVFYLFDGKKSDVSRAEPVNIQVSSFSWRLFHWGNFTWDIPGYFRTFTRRPKRRRVLFFSVELRSDAGACDLSLADMAIQYQFEYKLK